MNKNKPKVAFLCTHNACRSQIAEARSQKPWEENWREMRSNPFQRVRKSRITLTRAPSNG